MLVVPTARDEVKEADWRATRIDGVAELRGFGGAGAAVERLFATIPNGRNGRR
jgi:hypothetical protein